MKTIISFDIDGVLARFGRGFVKSINRLFPEKNLSLDYEPASWFYTEVLNPEEMKQAWEATIATRNLWKNLDSYEENVEALARFVHREHKNFDVYFITSRVDTPGDSAFSQTAHWLLERDLMLYNTSLLVVKEAKEKQAILRALHIEASVDDYLPTAISSNEIEGHQSFLYNRPWNVDGRPENLRVVSNLESYLEEVIKLHESK